MPSPKESTVEVTTPTSISDQASEPAVADNADVPEKRKYKKRRSTRISEVEERQEAERKQRLAAKKQLQKEVVFGLQLEEYAPNTNNGEESPNGWNEPALASSIPTVTGLPLGSFPSKKIKKEYLWPRKKNTYQKKNNKKVVPEAAGDSAAKMKQENEDDALESDDDLESEANEPIKNSYDSGLKTKASESLTALSGERLADHSKLVPVEKEGSGKYQKKRTKNNSQRSAQLKNIVPATPSRPKTLAHDSDKKIKRSPKKARANAFGYGSTDLTGQKRTGAFDFDDPTKDNEDFCSACGGLGIFLCCEACPKSFHFICCDPPMDEASLPEGNWYCNECLSRRKKPKKYDVGIFSKLLNQCELRNPRKFELPRKLRESTFENVSTGPNGEYQDASVIKNSRPIKVGRLEESDPLNIYDKDGKPLICYKCGLSGLEKEITKCGYCDLSWHLDCLSPPLPSVKTLGTKWKCPNHVTDLIPDKKRRFKKQNMVDVSMSRGFHNNGDIEIKSLSDDEIEDAVALPTPNYLKTYYKNGEIHAPVGDELEKIMTMNNITYRLPERGLILDFIDSSKVKKLKEVEALHEQNNEVLASLEADKKDAEKQVVESMSALHDVPVVHPKLKFKDLLEAVSNDLNPTTKELSQEEINDLKYLKELIDIKGRENLLKFIQSQV